MSTPRNPPGRYRALFSITARMAMPRRPSREASWVNLNDTGSKPIGRGRRRQAGARRRSPVSTRCGLTGVDTHDRLRPSLTPARKQRPHQAVASPTIAYCLLPRLRRSASRRKPCCSSCGAPAPISGVWSRRFRGISSRSSWCPSRAWTLGSGGSPRPGGRSATGWPSGESRSTGSSGDDVPGS